MGLAVPRSIRAFKYLRTASEAEGLLGKAALTRYYVTMLAAHGLRATRHRLPRFMRYRVPEPRLSREVILRSRTGRFVLRRGTADGWVVGGGYEPHVHEFLASALRPGQVFVDVGAHIGRYTVMAGRLLGPGGVVIAVEPGPDNFDALLKNVRQNALANVIPIKAACWSSDGELQMIFSSPVTSFWHRVGPLTESRARVSARSLDTITHDLGLGAIDVIKIDTEGAGPEVLEGARTILSGSPAVQVLFEAIRPHELERSSRTLQELGFTVRRLGGDEYLATRQPAVYSRAPRRLAS
jgi:FkbM family methyltransferase